MEIQLLPIQSMARRLRVSADWLRGQADAGRLPHVKADRQYLFNAALIEQILLRRASLTPSKEVAHGSN